MGLGLPVIIHYRFYEKVVKVKADVAAILIKALGRSRDSALSG